MSLKNTLIAGLALLSSCASTPKLVDLKFPAVDYSKFSATKSVYYVEGSTYSYGNNIYCFNKMPEVDAHKRKDLYRKFKFIVDVCDSIGDGSGGDFSKFEGSIDCIKDIRDLSDEYYSVEKKCIFMSNPSEKGSNDLKSNIEPLPVGHITESIDDFILY